MTASRPAKTVALLLTACVLLACAQDRFPLHFIVFKQISSHIPHEGNVEQLFSRSGYLFDPNMDPDYLATLTTVGKNKAAFQPTWQQILNKYLSKFGKE